MTKQHPPTAHDVFNAAEESADAEYAKVYRAAWVRFGCTNNNRGRDAFNAYVRPFWRIRCAKVNRARDVRKEAHDAAVRAMGVTS